MNKIVVDTNVYSFLCHGRIDVARLLFEYDEVVVPAVVVGELEAGFRNGVRYAENKAGLDRFLALSRVRIAEVNHSVAEEYGRVHSNLKSRGVMIPLNDVWIAATALSLKSPLVSFDNHFTNVEGLDLILKEVAS